MSKSDNKFVDVSEEFLLHFFDQPQSQKIETINQLLSRHPSWPILYHLSPQRQLLLEWYDFNPSLTLLEIGAGCGALTQLFLRKVHRVTCLELEPIRSKIIKKRYADYPHLKTVSAHLTDFHPKTKFNYITLVGVLEYAGKYFYPQNNDYSYQPFIDCLSSVKQLLNRDGLVFIAIENKLGLKYLAACPEDHYGSVFESVEDYPHYCGIRTFSKSEIVTILKSAGFGHVNFYYPFPDYKLPQHIYSQDFIHQNFATFLANFPSTLRQSSINQTLLAKSIFDADLIDQFCNSFLIIAQI